MEHLSANVGNYIRVWLSNSLWDIEEKAGIYDEKKAARIDRFIEMARRYHLRIKMTLEHFRSITIHENPQQWATKTAYHKSSGGPLDSVRQYLTTKEGHLLFLNKIDYYKNRYGSDTLFFGWELWNEMNALKGPQDSIFYAWNKKMLAEVKKRFPENLVMQSLGRFDGEYAKPGYGRLMVSPGNDVRQGRRCFELGAEREVCHAPMDIICSTGIEDLKACHQDKPVIRAETGAVEPNHAGPSKYYSKDTAGILLHDILFAPFFTGSAAPGMSWHWESYVHKNNLWYHYGRFNDAIKGIDPIRESLVPFFAETEQLRVYTLKGTRISIYWIRDKKNNWKSELEQNIPPSLIKNIKLDLHETGSAKTAEVYDPWTNKWTKVKPKNKSLTLPDFKRSDRKST